jgi:hypothetical protein
MELNKKGSWFRTLFLSTLRLIISILSSQMFLLHQLWFYHRNGC